MIDLLQGDGQWWPETDRSFTAPQNQQSVLFALAKHGIPVCFIRHIDGAEQTSASRIADRLVLLTELLKFLLQIVTGRGCMINELLLFDHLKDASEPLPIHKIATPRGVALCRSPESGLLH